MQSIELFSGAGGLALGISQAGIHHRALFEWNRDACETIRANQRRGAPYVKDWSLHEGDVRSVDFRQFGPGIDLLAGGPPCQPFSLGGKHRGSKDERNMFPEVFRAVRELRPRAILIENVKGLMRRAFAEYFEYIYLQLSHPSLERRPQEDWTSHRSRLEKHHTGGHDSDLEYRVVFRLLNAADFGVPQRRERVFLVGFRSDLGLDWSFPEPTHSSDALLYEQWVTGDYWQRHQIPAKERPAPSGRLSERVLRLRQRPPSVRQPWSTVRDAIADLPDPARPSPALNHWVNPGARTYFGHTGSPLDEPAKTLKAGDHGVPGGENMLAFPDGSVRYFTVREAARLQTFPDSYSIEGAWSEAMRQLGNAVPVRLANFVAADIKDKLSRHEPGDAVQPAAQEEPWN
jgi:DNA (cytosine-5)-methyltransferase 1